jgi:hypothetical protein
MWLARGVVGVAVIMLIVLNIPGIADVRLIKTGDVTTYSAPLFGPIIFGVLGSVVGVVAVVYWMQRGWVHRGASMVLAALALYVLFNTPTGFNHQLVVTPDYFLQRIGSWYAPVETKVDFNSLMYVSVMEIKPDKKGRKAYDLRCIRKGGESVRVPVSDMIKKALPEILKRAAEHNVLIGDAADGRVIALDKWV